MNGVLYMMTLKQFADSEGISYEAARKLVTRHAEQLTGHVHTVGKARTLDDTAVEFLRQHRRQHPAVIVDVQRTEENDQLREQVETLKTQLLIAQQQIIDAEREKQKLIADAARLGGLIEAHTGELEQLRSERDQARQETAAYTPWIFGLYRRKKK